MATKTGTDGNDIIGGTSDFDFLYGGKGDDILLGYGDDDMLYGGVGKDTLNGGAGQDTLDGGQGADAMEGGAGDDVYFVDDVGDQVIEKLDSGRDTVMTSLSVYTLGANLEELTYTGSANASMSGNALNNSITTGNGNDTLFGGDGRDMLYSGAGNDAIYGGKGEDYLFGHSGNDTLYGGEGDDQYFLGNFADGKGDQVVEFAGGGIDTINTAGRGYANSTGAAGEIHWFILGEEIENLYTGYDFRFQLTGNALNNIISGGARDDTLNGGAGADTLIGAAGSDTYYLDNAGDVIQGEAVGAVGNDLARVSGIGSWTVTLGIERVEIGNGMSEVIGNAEANDIRGSASAETIRGEGGNDVLFGNGGADSLYGGDGNDTLKGAAGEVGATLDGGNDNDLYWVMSSADAVVEAVDAGYDNALVMVDWKMAANVETADVWVDTGLAVTGNSLANHIGGGGGSDTLKGGNGNDTIVGGMGNDLLEGGAGSDSLTGGTGSDTLRGGAGNDTLVVDNDTDVVEELAAGGRDLVQSFVDHVLSANVEDLQLLGGAISGTGNELGNKITGSSLNNLLSGGAGNDTLIGGGGADELTGGLGKDRFVWAFTDSGVADGARDTVMDFVTGQDKLDLRLVDAVAATVADEAFQFLATGAFTAVAGQARYEAISGGVQLQLDITGDGAADMAIDLMGITQLVTTDFLL